MNRPTPSTLPIGGRHGRAIGLFLLADFAVVCGIKIALGISGEILWMSHMALLLAGLGLAFRSTLAVTTALTAALVLHGIWLFDWACWQISGGFPLGVTNYLADATPWVWIATAHHFYLTPLLVLFIIRHRQYPREALLAAIALFLALTSISRGWLSPTDNINFAFGLSVDLDHPFVHWANRVPGPVYMLGLNLFVALVMLGPTALLLARLTRPPSPSPGKARNPRTAPTGISGC
ncbi:MAG: hypothetical protein GY778_22170 [bacterium]|nr:hypothetical protein [bacterium]